MSKINNPLTIKEFSSLNKVRDYWISLQDKQKCGSVFLSYEWIDAALRWSSRETETRFLLVENDTDAIGLCALQSTRQKRNGINRRVLEFLHVPDSQLCGVLAEDHVLPIVLETLAEYLANQNNWDEIRLCRLPVSEKIRNSYESAFIDAGLNATWIPESGNPCINLNNSWQAYYATRTRRLKKGNNLVANKLKKAYQHIDIEHLYGKAITTEQWSRALKKVKNVSAKSWKQDTGKTLDHAGPEAFINCISEHAIKQGWLSLWLLNLDGNTAAIEYQLIYNGHVHALRADYDETYAELSPGTFLNWKLLEQLFDKNLTRYEMGPGNNAYKQRWAEADLPLCTFVCYNNTLMGQLLKAIEQTLKPWLKKIIRLCRLRR